MRKNLLYFIPLALALLLYIVVEMARPKPIDWTPTYAKEDKIPFGCYISYTLLKDIFPGQPVVPVDLEAGELFSNPSVYNGSNYVFIGSQFTPETEEVQSLLRYAENGGIVFISADVMSYDLESELGFTTDYYFQASDSTLAIRLVSPAFRGRGNIMQMDKVYRCTSFASFDTASTVVLGLDQDDRVNFVRMMYGSGWFYIHTTPKAFTNYALLNDDSRYISAALSYLPVRKTLWDEYYKVGVESQTPLRYVFSNNSLRWAWYLGLASVVLFMLFEARRRQRIIPVINPPANATLDFVTTVGKLYFQHGDLKNIAEKKITYFLDYVRTRLNVPTAKFDDKFIEQASGRSGIPEQEVRDTIEAIRLIQSKPAIAEKDLVFLHERIENFYRKSAR